MLIIVNKKRFLGTCVLFVSLIAAVVLFFCLKTPIEKQIYPQKYKSIVNEAASAYGVDELLIYSVMKAESKFNEKAVSKSGAKGLMQLMDETAVWVSEKSGIKIDNIYDAETNIMIGTWYLSYLSSNCEDTVTALASYNAGLANVEKWCKEAGTKTVSTEDIQFAETKDYVTKILKYYDKYKEIYGGK